MNLTKYQVFISSTYSDLAPERESIIKTILELYHIPIGMEMFSAEDEDQWEIIRRTIEVSDYYILVLGLRYGSKTSEGISFTQKEYEYALEKKIPILAFIMNEMAPLSKDKRDDDLTEVKRFREKVLANSKMAQFWQTKDELIKNVSISLTKQIMQKPGVGWVRGDKVGNEEALSKELTNLSKENRQLRERVLELELKVSEKSPNLVLDINPVEIDEKFDSYEFLKVPEMIDFSKIDEHLKAYLSEDKIDQYNKSLPCQDIVDEYNHIKERLYKVNKYSTPLGINVSNRGSKKATNVYIDIVFPDEFFVYEKSVQFDEPKNPLPSNPIMSAQKKYEEEKRKKTVANTSALFGFATINGLADSFMPTAALISPRMNINIPTLNQKFWTKLDDNKLTIKMDSLLHTRSTKLDDEYMIVPMKSGKHQITVSLICEEYEDLKKQIVEMEIK